MAYKTIYETFLDAVKKHPERTALMYKKDGPYQKITYRELNDSIEAIAAALGKLGVGRGDMVAIMSYNRPEWAITDLAVLKLGAIVVPIYYVPGHVLPAGNVKYILGDSKASVIFVENDDLLSVVEQIRSDLPSLRHTIIFDYTADTGVSILKFSDLKNDPERSAQKTDLSPDDIATIVYTSGTTGEPKGVVLTHANIISNAMIALKKFNFTPEDVLISYLPIGHMFERTCGYYTVLFAGGSIGYAQNLTTVAQDAEEIRPTIILAIPRVIEKAYNTAVNKIEGSSILKRGLVAAAIKNLNKRANLKYKGKSVPLGLKLKCAIYDKLVASKFKKLGGGRIRVIVAGSAPLNRQIAKILYVLGFNIVEGYGLTETAPIVACNLVEDNILGTVGKPFDGIEVKIGENEEILVKGPNVMKGYFNKPEETAKVIDRDGWFHTGDQGKFDEHGHLVITGRIKELIVTSGGKKIPPAPIEAKITFSPFVEQAVVCGDNKQFLVGLIVPSRDAIEQYAKENKIHYENYPKLLQDDEIKKVIKGEVESSISDLPSYEKIKAFVLLEQGFTVENSMLTATLKLKRNKIMEKYCSIFDLMYQDKSATQAPRNIVFL